MEEKAITADLRYTMYLKAELIAPMRKCSFLSFLGSTYADAFSPLFPFPAPSELCLIILFFSVAVSFDSFSL